MALCVWTLTVIQGGVGWEEGKKTSWCMQDLIRHTTILACCTKTGSHLHTPQYPISLPSSLPRDWTCWSDRQLAPRQWETKQLCLWTMIRTFIHLHSIVWKVPYLNAGLLGYCKC